MDTRPLGTTGIDVSALCLGCMLFGSTVDRDTSFAVLDAYYEAGGRFLDTSNNYAFWVEGMVGGESEALLGEWLRSRGCRDEMIIATKLGGFRRPLGHKAVENAEGLSAGAIQFAVDESLERMGLEHVDLLYTHFEDRTVPLEETLSALDAQVTAGKVRAIGASNHATWRLERSRNISREKGLAVYQVIQQRLSYLMPQRTVALGVQKLADHELLDYLHAERDLMLVGYTVLLRGTYDSGVLSKAYDTPENVERLRVLKKIAADMGVTANQLALAWASHCAPIAVPLIATSRPDHLAELVKAPDIKLSADIMEQLNSAGRKGV